MVIGRAMTQDTVLQRMSCSPLTIMRDTTTGTKTVMRLGMTSDMRKATQPEPKKGSILDTKTDMKMDTTSDMMMDIQKPN